MREKRKDRSSFCHRSFKTAVGCFKRSFLCFLKPAAAVNSFSVKKFMEAKMTRVKTDKVDSYFIAEYRRTFFFMKTLVAYNSFK
jgi:hypothetical protein